MFIATDRAHPELQTESHLELPVEEVLRRAKPLPPHEKMVIEDLTEEEGLAWWEAVNS